jgi:formamidopyrimidine-DNA glycosylase
VNVPELPEVETVRRGLVPMMQGAMIRSVEAHRVDLRWPLPTRFAERLRGRRIVHLGRRAKYLIAELDHDEVLIMHLGMSGSFRIVHASEQKLPGGFHHPRTKDSTHDHVVFHLASGASVTFNDPRRFGAMLMIKRAELETHPLMRNLGPEPLDPSFDAAYLARTCAKKKTSLKVALSDQRVVAGLGNIYVCEALHRARLSPKGKAGMLATRAGAPTPQAAKLVAAIKEVLHEAIAAGGSSLRDYVKADGELGLFQHAFKVYDREGKPCPRRGCRGKIRRIVQAGRSSFYCPVCQR